MTHYYGTAVPTPPGALRPVPLKDIKWCETAGCPRHLCVACRSNPATAH